MVTQRFQYAFGEAPTSLPDGARPLLKTVRSIAEVDAAEWDRLAGTNVLASHAWLRTLEESSVTAVRRRYIMTRDASGLLGAIVCRVDEMSETAAGLDHSIFGRLTQAARRLGLSTLPSLVCGSQMGLAAPVLVRDGVRGAARANVIDELVQGVDQAARENGWTVCFREVAGPNSDIGEVLARRGYLRSREMPTAYLDIRWNSFADFRRDLKKAHPSTEKNIRLELNRRTRHGLVIEQVEDPARHAGDLHRLMNAHYLRLNGVAFPFGPNLFERLKSLLGTSAMVYVARVDDQLMGVLVALQGGGALHLSMVGVEQPQGRASAVYFNLVYNQPIEDAIAANVRRMYFGKMLYEVKANRGCKALDGDIYLRVANRYRAAALGAAFACRSKRVAALSAVIPRENTPAMISAAPIECGFIS